MEINSITTQEHPFLQGLQDIVKTPTKLYISGVLPTHIAPAVAIVGTRKPTPYGKEVAYKLSFELAQEGIPIISGLAIGIDGIAHTAALDAGGTTIAVVANGLPAIYPRSHSSLAQRIVNNGGVLISEYPAGVSALPFQFLARNRLISGLSVAVVVVEAARRSGTLNTVSHALEQGKDIFAVPGNITSPLSAGCNELLKQGAYPVTTSADILQIIAPQYSVAHIEQLPLPNFSKEEALIFNLIKQGISDNDALYKASQLDVSTFNQVLTMLELQGVIHTTGGNQWSVR